MLNRIFFETEDNVELQGLISLPNATTDTVVISIHGMQSNCLKRREMILEKCINDAGMAYFSFNNRGHELMCYTRKTNGEKFLNGGSAFEEVLDCYYDIKGAVQKAISMGFTNIHLQGHSLGCTKIIYAYNRLKKEGYENLKFIKSVILLSLVDIIDCQKYDLGIDKYNEMLEYANKMESENRLTEFMPEESFDHPTSVETYLRYFKYNDEIDFAKFSDKNYDFKEINNIEVPLFIRWADHDLVIQNIDELIEFLKSKITNESLDIGYIKDTDHGYTNKEAELAGEIVKFVEKFSLDKC